MVVILERCISLDVGFFRAKLKTSFWQWTGSIVWSAGDDDPDKSSIGYRLSTYANTAQLTLLYTYDGQNVTQTVELETVPSNLNKGHYWVFKCPECGRRCKKLHLICGLFQHRTALPGVFYRRQARTKWAFARYMDAHDKLCEIWEAAEKPYFREYYAGRQTRRTVRMLRKMYKLSPRVSDSVVRQLLS